MSKEVDDLVSVLSAHPDPARPELLERLPLWARSDEVWLRGLHHAMRCGEVERSRRILSHLLALGARGIWGTILSFAVQAVGPAAPDAVVEVFRLHRHRQPLARFGEHHLLDVAVTRMASAGHCRTADDLAVALMVDPHLETLRTETVALPDKELGRIVASGEPWVVRAAAAIALAGTTQSEADGFPARRGHFALLRQVYSDAGVPALVVESIRLAAQKIRHPAVGLMGLAWLLAAEAGEGLHSSVNLGEGLSLLPRIDTARIVRGRPLYQAGGLASGHALIDLPGCLLPGQALDHHSREGRLLLDLLSRDEAVADVLRELFGKRRALDGFTFVTSFLDSGYGWPAVTWSGDHIVKLRAQFALLRHYGRRGLDPLEAWPLVLSLWQRLQAQRKLMGRSG